VSEPKTKRRNFPSPREALVTERSGAESGFRGGFAFLSLSFLTRESNVPPKRKRANESKRGNINSYHVANKSEASPPSLSCLALAIKSTRHQKWANILRSLAVASRL